MCAITGSVGIVGAPGDATRQVVIDAPGPAAGAEGSTRLVLLGTNGGPQPARSRSGISQVLVVNGCAYVVDCGSGVARQLVRSGISLSSLRGVFLTHLHSDHEADYFNLFLFGWAVIEDPVPTFGPGPAGGLGALPHDVAGRPPFPLINPQDPTPGLIEITNHQIRAHAYDINIRIREAGFDDLTELIVPHEIAIPPEVGAHGPWNVAPPMEPIPVMEDDNVKVTATLVRHAPVFPCFAYRFETADGSVVISGDTAPSANLVHLASGADILVHEVLELAFLERMLAGDPDADFHLRHFTESHTSVDDVGAVAADAGVGHLVLSHLVPGDDVIADRRWLDGARTGYGGAVTLGHDLLVLPVGP